MKRKIVICCLVALFGLSFCTKSVDLSPKERPDKNSITQERQYDKELEEIRKGIKGDLKIKLKKNAKSDYSWEITGKDTQEVLKANDVLKKRLGE
jgi:hypothetical protein